MTKTKDIPRPHKKGRPRFEDRGKTIQARKPWLAIVDVNGKPMSRSTWYRRQAEEREKPHPEDRIDEFLKILTRR